MPVSGSCCWVYGPEGCRDWSASMVSLSYPPNVSGDILVLVCCEPLPMCNLLEVLVLWCRMAWPVVTWIHGSEGAICSLFCSRRIAEGY